MVDFDRRRSGNEAAMEGSHLSNPVKRLAFALPCGAAAAMLFVAPALAADPAPSSTSVGPPTPLFTPSAPPSSSATPALSTHAAVASPGKHPAAPVQRIPLDGKPLIPPAAVPAKLGAAPEPRPALSLETDLEPLAPAPSPAAPMPKPPSS
jgi:hypothetical protein